MTSNTDLKPAPLPPLIRILVAEDSPLNLQVALMQLEKLGFEADGVADGNQVVDALKRQAYTLILMDCQMPEMNGYEATWQIRENEKNRGDNSHIHIVAMTANTEADTREKCRAAGMDDFINKPVQLAVLEAAVLRALAKRAVGKIEDNVIDPFIIANLQRLRLPNKPDPLTALIYIFLHEAPAQLDLMKEAVAKNEANSLARVLSAASRLKGSAINLGARNLAALADEIEQAAKNWSLAETLPLIDRAKKEFSRVREALLKVKSNDKG